ncbi:MAG: hypothetical protein KBC18_03050 [Candidatus Saccharicenans sp.]|jgi:hypothetical protein|nr:hypothetical protein [Candidatus Saccharicenans sp.]
MNSKIIGEKEESFLDYARELFRVADSANLNRCYQPELFFWPAGQLV